MARNQSNAGSHSIRSRSDGSVASVEIDSEIENELIELVKALARAAAREDYRKVKDTDTNPLTVAGSE
jgi:DNA-binding protein YbaB